MIFNITNKTKRKLNKVFLENIVNVIVEKSGIKIKKNIEINLIFVSDKEMTFLNNIYRNKKKSTDVLAFRCDDGKDFIYPPDGVLRIGDIFIAPDVVKNNSIRYKVDFCNELRRVLIHGILHLFGYDHKVGESEARIMENMESKIANFINRQFVKL